MHHTFAVGFEKYELFPFEKPTLMSQHGHCRRQILEHGCGKEVKETDWRKCEGPSDPKCLF